jgi:hypothetical protein|tara:strand:- start:3324 stop:3635 length:312 start_codon:yes stop_codon:yes gene_type:complete
MAGRLDVAVDRLLESDWSPHTDLRDLGLSDPVETAKYEAAARLCASTFNSIAGQKTLEWMIGNFLMQMTEPQSGEQAAFRDGQANVVKQILYQLHIAKHGVPK